MSAPQRRKPALDRFLRRPEVELLVGLKRTQLNELIKRGQFPAPVQLSDAGRAVAWLASEVADWQASRLKKRATVPRRDEMAGARAARRTRKA